MRHVLFFLHLLLLSHDEFFYLFFWLLTVFLLLHLLHLFLLLLILHLLLIHLLRCHHHLPLSGSLCSGCGPDLNSSTIFSLVAETLRRREWSQVLINISTWTCWHLTSIRPSSRFLCWLSSSSSTYSHFAIRNECFKCRKLTLRICSRWLGWCNVMCTDRMKEVWISTEAITVSWNLCCYLRILHMLLIPHIGTVARLGALETAQEASVVISNLSNFFDSVGSVKWVICVKSIRIWFKCVPCCCWNVSRWLQINLEHLAKQNSILVLNFRHSLYSNFD